MAEEQPGAINILCAFAGGSTDHWDFTSPCGCSLPLSAPCGITDVAGDRRRAVLLNTGEATVTIPIAAGQATEMRFSLFSKEGGLVEIRTVGAQAWSEPVDSGRWVEARIPAPVGRELTIRVEGQVALASPRLFIPEALDTRAPGNSILYLSDTLRSDHTSLYGYARDTTPFLEGLAKGAYVYDLSYSSAAWTRPSTASLLTGLAPSFHTANARRSLPQEVVTLAERFQAAGWSTWAFVANGNIHNKGLGFEQGFDRFKVVQGEAGPANARDVHSEALDWIDQFGDEKFFIYIHTIDPHSPYNAPAKYIEMFTDPDYDGEITPDTTRKKNLRQLDPTPEDVAFVTGLYDAEVRYQDDQLRDFWNALESRLLTRDLTFAFTSDHGEEFFEHGDWEHGRRLWEEQVRVPLLLKLPTRSQPTGGRVSEPVQSVDLPTTFAAAFGLGGPPTFQGVQLPPWGAPLPADRAVYLQEIRHDVQQDFRGLRVGDLKVIVKEDLKRRRTFELGFNLSTDPGEQQNLYSVPDGHRLLEETKRRLMTFSSHELSGSIPTELVEPRFSKEESEQLRALGYIE